MSTTVIVVELLGITAAAVGIGLAQASPRDLRAWWERQEWLRFAVSSATAEPVDDATGRVGLDILPGRAGADRAPAAAAPSALPQPAVPSPVPQPVPQPAGPGPTAPA